MQRWGLSSSLKATHAIVPGPGEVWYCPALWTLALSPLGLVLASQGHAGSTPRGDVMT